MNEISKIGSSDFGRDRMITKLAHLSVLGMLFVFLGASTLPADNLHQQIINGTTIDAEIATHAELSNLPIGRPSKNRVDKDLFGLFRLACEIVGRIDMTSVNGWTLEQTHDQKNSKSSLKVIEDCFLVPGQNTKHVIPQNSTKDETCRTSEIRHDKSTTKDSPADNPLSFAREYLQTKK